MHATDAGAQPLRATYTISAFFPSKEAATRAMMALVSEAIPRSLIDVAVSPQANVRFFAGRGRRFRNSTFSFAGRGALIGLLVAATFTIALTLSAGLPEPGPLALVQLFGPNIGVVVGGAFGALWALLRRVHPSRHHYRALERDAILLIVQLRPEEEVDRLEKILLQAGGEDIQATPDSPEGAGSE